MHFRLKLSQNIAFPTENENNISFFVVVADRNSTPDVDLGQ